MSMRVPFLCFLALLFGQSAFGYDVYINNVKVNGLHNQKFDRVSSVRFDERGDVRIDAPGYSIEVDNSSSFAQNTSGAASINDAADVPVGVSRYWILATVKQVGAYRVRLTANNREVGQLLPTDNKLARDITAQVVSGSNNVQATFLPMPNAPSNPSEAIEIVVGIGKKNPDGSVTIEKQQEFGKMSQPGGRQSPEAQTVRFNAD